MVIALALGSSALVAFDANAQGDVRNNAQIDSLENVRDGQIQAQKTTDAQTLSDLKDSKSDTKREAKEAQRVETNAENSAKASKNAYKTEKKAQKARRHADAQAEKAAKAKKKTN